MTMHAILCALTIIKKSEEDKGCTNEVLNEALNNEVNDEVNDEVSDEVNDEEN